MGGTASRPVPPPVKEEEFKRQWAATTKMEWTNAELECLKKSILERKMDSKDKPFKPKLLVFGPTGIGKSSFCNGIVSAMEGRKNVSSYFAVGSTGGSFTKGFHGKKFEDIWLIDMAGICETKTITDQNIKDIASGKIPFYAKLTDNLALKDREKLMVPKAGKNDVSCVIVVLSLVFEIPIEIKRQISALLELAGEGVISYRLILTHVDACDEKFKNPENLPSVMDSQAIQEAVMSMSSQTGVPPTAISVVRNYVNEPETDFNTNFLLLHAMEKVVSAAHEQIDKKADQEEMKKDLYNDEDD